MDPKWGIPKLAYSPASNDNDKVKFYCYEIYSWQDESKQLGRINLLRLQEERFLQLS